MVQWNILNSTNICAFRGFGHTDVYELTNKHINIILMVEQIGKY